MKGHNVRYVRDVGNVGIAARIEIIKINISNKVVDRSNASNNSNKKMITLLVRIFKAGWQSFWRNKWVSSATIGVMVLALFSLSNIYLFGIITKTALRSIEDKVDISIYFNKETAEEDIQKIQHSIETLEEVKTTEYISKESALKRFKERHYEDEVILKSLEELEENPLKASLNIKARDTQEYAAIARYLENGSLGQFIDKVTYSQNQLVIERLSKIINTTKNGGTMLGLVLAFIAAAVTLNTIRLAIYSNRDELSVMRLVGASNTFIRGPYVVEGILYGLAGSIVAFIILIPTVHFLSPYISVFIPEMDLAAYFSEHFFSIFSGQTLAGICLGSLSSLAATRRYLKI